MNSILAIEMFQLSRAKVISSAIRNSSGETLRNFCNDTRHLLLNQTGFSRGYLATVQGGKKMTVQSYVLTSLQ